MQKGTALVLGTKPVDSNWKSPFGLENFCWTRKDLLDSINGSSITFIYR